MIKTCHLGHPLEEPNLVYNGEGFRECKRCAWDRQNRSRKERRVAMKWLKLIIQVGEVRIKRYESQTKVYGATV